MSNKMTFQRDYKTSLAEQVSNSSTGEIEFQLNKEPISEIGFLLIDKGSENQESVFYHRKIGTSVFVYGANRSNPVVHEQNTQVQMVSSIEAMNYLSELSFNQFYIYKKNETDLIITGGTVYVNGTNVEIAEVDTSEQKENQLLIPNAKNYIYVDQGQVRITDVYDSKRYTLGEADVSISGIIESYTNYKVFPLGQYNADGLYNLDANIFVESGGIQTIIDEALTARYLAANSVTREKIIDNAINTVKIADDAITTAKILSKNVTTAKIADAAITALQVATNAITEAKILADAVTTSKIKNSNVTTAKIADLNVTTQKLSQNIQDILSDAQDVRNIIKDDGIGNAFLTNDGTYKLFPDASYINDNEVGLTKIWSSQKTKTRIEEAEAKAVALEGDQEVEGYKNMVHGVSGKGSTMKKVQLGEDMDTEGIVVSLGEDNKVYKGGNLYYGILQTTGLADEYVFIDTFMDTHQSGLEKGKAYGYNKETGVIEDGDDFISISDTTLIYSKNIQSNQIISGLKPVNTVIGYTEPIQGVIDMTNTNAEAPLRYQDSSMGQTFTTPSELFLSLGNLKWRIGAKANSSSGAKYRFFIYNNANKDELIYQSGDLNQSSYSANHTFSVNLSSLGLKENTQYYAEFRKTTYYSSSYYFNMRYNDQESIPGETMYIDGVEQPNNHMYLQIHYEYRNTHNHPLIPFRKAYLGNELEGFVYPIQSNIDNFKLGFYQGITNGYKNTYSEDIESVLEVYGDNVYGGLITHEQTTINTLKLKGGTIGSGDFDVRIYPLLESGELDFANKIFESLGNSFNSPIYTVDPAEFARKGSAWETARTFTATSSGTIYGVNYDYKGSYSSQTSYVRMTINGTEVISESIGGQDGAFYPHTFEGNFKYEIGDVINIEVRQAQSNYAYPSYVKNIVFSHYNDSNLDIDLQNLSISANTDYGYTLSCPAGDASNKLIIQGAYKLEKEPLTIFDLAAQQNLRTNTVDKGVVGYPELGERTVTIKAETYYSSGSYGYFRLKQNGNVVLDMNTSNTSSWITQTKTGTIDFSLGEVRWEDYSNTNDGSTSGVRNRTTTVVDWESKGFKSETGEANTQKDFIMTPCDVISNNKINLISTTRQGIMRVVETLEVGREYYVDSFYNLTTDSNSDQNIYVGYSINEHELDLDYKPLIVSAGTTELFSDNTSDGTGDGSPRQRRRLYTMSADVTGLRIDINCAEGNSWGGNIFVYKNGVDVSGDLGLTYPASTLSYTMNVVSGDTVEIWSQNTCYIYGVKLLASVTKKEFISIAS